MHENLFVCKQAMSAYAHACTQYKCGEDQKSSCKDMHTYTFTCTHAHL